VNYPCDGKAEFSAVSHDPSEISLMWFDETFIIITSVKNICAD